MSKKTQFTCGKCGIVRQKSGGTNCWSNDSQKKPARPGNCPANEHMDIINESFDIYKTEGSDAEIARVSAKVEGLCYQTIPNSNSLNARWSRVEDTIAFAKLMNYKKIGIASCIGLLYETNKLASIFEAQGFNPIHVCCKTGSIDKIELGLTKEEKVRGDRFEPSCNPIAQAKLLNNAKTDMNIIVGLCVGHDMLFSKYSDAPVTTLVVKDRVTGHNPASVLYNQYYNKKLLDAPMVIEK